MGEQLSFAALSRRSFVKGAAALAAGALADEGLSQWGLSTAAAAETDSDTQIFSGVCRGGCATHCRLNVHVRDGQVVRTSAGELVDDPRYTRYCSKGASQVARVYSSKRLQYPMRRVGEKGSGELERTSWDEAISEITEKWKGYQEQYGPSSIMVATNSGNTGMVCASAVTRFQNVMGTSSLAGCNDLALSYATSLVTGFGAFAQQNESADWPNAKTFICWGADPTISTPQNMHFILDAKENGARYIVIDTMYNANAGKSDWFVPVRPSTDGALAFGALNYLLEQGWEDEDFLRSATEAPFFVKSDGTFLRMSDLGVEPVDTGQVDATGQPVMSDPCVVWDEDSDSAVAADQASRPSLASRSEVGGIDVTLVYDMVKDVISQWDVDRASQACGVDADDIRELARTYAQDGPVTTFIMFGPDHYINGHYNYWPMYMLSAFTGNICKSGAGMGYTMSMSSFFIDGTLGSAPVDVNGNAAQGASQVSVPKGYMPQVLQTGEYAGSPLTVKSLFVMNTNPVATSPNHNQTTDWMKQLEYVVVSDMVMSETAMYADILLPVCHWFEYCDMGSDMGSTPFFMLQEKCVEPQFESKPDFEILGMLADAMGYGDFFRMSNEEYAAALLDTPACQAIGASWDALKERKSIKHFKTSEQTGTSFISFEGGKFNTTTGKFKLYDEAPTPFYYAGQDIDYSKEVLPHWEPPRYADEESEERSSGKYPFWVFSQHMRTRTHTQWWDVDYTKQFDPEPVVKINPDDAQELGISDGDTVRLYNDFGEVVLKARVNAGLPRKMLSCGRSFQSFEFTSGHFANLSCSDYNQMIPNSAHNDVAVAVERVEE